MNKPKIGITPLFDEDKNSIWMLPEYMEGIIMADGLPFIIPFTKNEEDISRIAEEFDGFLFTGGQDIDPEIYGEEKLPFCGRIHSGRDNLELRLLEKIVQKDKPLLGICRGLQLLNAVLGGTLYQDLNIQRKEKTLLHHQNHPYNQPVHKVKINENSKLGDIFNEKEIKVNSLHHQAVKKLADKLKTAAISEDGIIEAAYMPDKKFITGVQWHPEFLYLQDELSRRLFKKFINNCK
ncbi:MAG: gamma-glutamyl-gamma-aminobutyrate hydrolase family protein [Bacillota bacterium]|nr:gamma-glutamyl-gamma-aminobutyrate hydrolase family protein [Bacillota bacterium]